MSVEARTTSKALRRIVPLMAFALLLNYLDKVNVGFAALRMNQDLGLSNTEFGTAVGFFAIGYILSGVPSTLLLHRFGARRWIAFIMVAWGLCSAATAFITTVGELKVVRLLLGAAEAGFVPGIIYYLSQWFPSARRGRVLGAFLMIGPLGFVVGGPASSLLLDWDGPLGFAGWQWLFILEALPTVLLAPVVFWMLTDRPAQAHWLSTSEKDWLIAKLAEEQSSGGGSRVHVPIWRAFTDSRVWVLSVVYLAMGTSGMGVVYFLPLVIRSMGFTVSQSGVLAALPAAAAAVSLPLWGWWADRSRSREAVVAAACASMALGLASAAFLLSSPWALVCLCLTMIGFYGFVAPFWTLPSAFLTGASAAAGIALINVVGNLANYAGPALLGRISDVTRSYGTGLQYLAAVAAGAAAIMAVQAVCNRRT